MIVIVYGYEGSGDGHWQRLLERELRARGADVEFPPLPDPLDPRKDAWVDALAECVERAEGAPVTFVCHSLGCWAVDHLLAERRPTGAHAVLLVAPPSPYLLFEPVQSFLPPPLSREAWSTVAPRSLLVGGDDDEYASVEEQSEIARTLGIEHRIVPGGRHLNTDAGFGPWTLPLEWLSSVGAIPPEE